MNNAAILKLAETLVETIPQGMADAGMGQTYGGACILSTKAVVEVFRAKGVRARAVPVKLRVLSPELVRRIEAGEKMDEENQQEWLDAGAWEVSIGHVPAERSGWDGHLVALVKERWLVDASAHQARRPAKGIDVEPFVSEVHPDFLKGHACAVEQNGSLLIYEYDPENKLYLRAPAWTEYRCHVRDGKAELVRLRAPTHDDPVASSILVATRE